MAIGGRLVGTAFLIGGGALAVIAVVAAPRLFKAARPVVREGLRRGLGLFERARSAAAELADDVEDLVAEVRSEVSQKPPA